MIKTNKIVIIGGYGTSLNIAESIIDAQINHHLNVEFIGFVNDVLSQVNGHKVVCKLSELKQYLMGNDHKVIFVLYKPDRMKERVVLQKEVDIPLNRYTNFIHPTCFVSNSVKLGIGNVFLSNTVIQSNVIIGNHNILNSNVVIEHDSTINNNNFIAASSVIGSNVVLKNGSFIGLNSSVRESIIVDDYAFLGMGSVLTKNTLKNSMYYGVPAKKV